MFRTLRITTFSKSIVVAALLAVSACGGHAPTNPTPTLDVFCPANASVKAAQGQVTATVTFAAPTTTGGKAPISTTCTQNSGDSFTVGSTTVSCTAVDGAGRSAECTFSVSVDPPPTPQLAYTKFLAFGDSETEGKVNAVPLEVFPTSYTLKLQPMLQARYPTQTIIVGDNGYGGQEAADPATLRRLDDQLASDPPQVILLMDGANDLNGHLAAGIAPAVNAMGTLGQHAADKGVQVFLATIPPMNPSRQPGAPFVAPYNGQLVNLANVRNWTLVDVNAAFHGDLGLLGSDGLHPTDAGYQVIAQAFYDAIVAKYDVTPAASIAFKR